MEGSLHIYKGNLKKSTNYCFYLGLDSNKRELQKHSIYGINRNLAIDWIFDDIMKLLWEAY